MTADDVRKAIKKKYSDNRRYAVCEEVGLTTGGGCRRLDMIIVDCYQSNEFRIDGIEIKVSTQDLRHELESPDKHNVFYNNLDYFTLACPAEVVNPLIDVIPKKWGVLIVNEDGTTRYKKKPLALHDEAQKVPISRGFLASLVRSIQYHRPYDKELKEKYDEGFEKGKEIGNQQFSHMRETVRRNAQKIEDYDNIIYELRLYNTDIKTAIEELKAFRRLRLSEVNELVDALKNKLDGITSMLSSVNDENKQ